MTVTTDPRKTGLPTTRSFGNTVVGIGDSIMRAQGVANNMASFLEIFAASSGGAVKLLGNAGVNGNKTADMLARFAVDVLATDARYVLLMEAANDAMNSVSVATNRANMQAMAQMAIGAGKVPVIVGAPPVNSYNVWQYNASQQLIAEQFGIPYANPWLACTANGAWIDSTYSFDGVHPTPKASRIAGAALWSQIGALFHGSPDLTWTNDDPNGMLANGCFATNVTGVPTGWTGAVGLTHAAEAGTGDVLGNWWKMTASGITGWQVNSRTGIALPSGWVSGDRVRMSCRIRTVGFEANGGAANGSYPMQGKLGFYISLNWGGVSDTLLLRQMCSDLNGVFSVDGVIPVGTSGTSTIQAVVTQTAAASGEVSIAQLQVHNLTRLSA